MDQANPQRAAGNRGLPAAAAGVSARQIALQNSRFGSRFLCTNRADYLAVDAKAASYGPPVTAILTSRSTHIW